MKTTHPRAVEVAQELGVRFGYANAEKTLVSVDCCQADFDEILAEMDAEGPSKPSTFNHAAYARLQNEGYSDRGVIDNTPAHPQDY